MIQTELVRKMIVKHFPEAEIEIVPVITQGDKILEKSLTAFGGKGVFTKELEEQLIKKNIDLAVHSAKDLPMDLPEGLCIGAVLPREDPRDVLVTVTGIKGENLPLGSVIGTSSLRRELQIKKINPGVQIKLLRGNVETRLEKLKNGEYHGIILAAAGLKRLGLLEAEGFSYEFMDPEEFVPAAGQGILALETREGELGPLLDILHSPQAAMALAAERTFLTVLGGGCNAPSGAYCTGDENGLRMKVMYGGDERNLVYRESCMACAESEEIEELPYILGETLADQVLKGNVVLAGAGPGDQGLISVKALEAVRQADVIVYDNLISPSILNEARMDAQLIYAGKRMGSHYMKQEEISRLLVEQANMGKMVVRLKGGDPFVFGRGGEEAAELSANRIPFQIIPGISSSYSVPAYAGIPVTDRNVSSSFHVITGHEGENKKGEGLDFSLLAKTEGTLVFLMGLHSLEHIAAGLIAEGMSKNTPAAVIEKGTTSRQRTVTGKLGQIFEDAKRAGITTPAITVVGNAVSLRDTLAWFEQGSLFGTKVLVTGTRQMAEQMREVLTPLGAETETVSLIEAEAWAAEETLSLLSDLNKYQWIVFTSSNGVHCFFQILQELEIDIRAMLHMKIAAIGKGTEETLKAYGFYCDFVPDVYTSQALAAQWAPTVKPGEKVLFAGAEESSSIVPEALKNAGIVCSKAVLYRTVVDTRRKEELNRLEKEADYIVITSGSGARAFASMSQGERRGKLVSIGPVTAGEAKKAGLFVNLTAAVYTAEGIADAILWDQKQRSRTKENQ